MRTRSGEKPAAWRRIRRRLGRVTALNLLWNALRGRVAWRWALLGSFWGWRFHLRDSQDAGIFFEVVICDIYSLDGIRFQEEDVIVDVGAHVGSFGFLCHLLGCRHLAAYEALAANFTRLRHNLRSFPGAESSHAAVFRSDGIEAETLVHSGAPKSNSGGGNVLFSGDVMRWDRETLERHEETSAKEKVSTLALDEILAPYTRVRLLKLDCEGSEFPILLTSELLPRVEKIVGEYHEVPSAAFPRLHSGARIAGYESYRFEHLEERLSSLGFAVRHEKRAPLMGLFWATRGPHKDVPR